MRYDVRQRTAYTYDYAVATSQHAVRLVPADRPGIEVVRASLRVDPQPTERHEHRDFFGNRVTAVTFDVAHDHLEVVMTARVTVAPVEPPPAAATPPWNEVYEAAGASFDLDPGAPVHGLFPSRGIPLTPEITAYASKSFPEGRPVLASATELMERIHAEFIYEPGATAVTTSPREAFALKRGVCQDFAQVFIAGLRGLGVPARYVSGYLRTLPPPGKRRLQGADATHAWVSVWCGEEAGWIGLDPTNAMVAGLDHIPLAIGRDYADVAPIDGVIVSAGDHTLTVEVDVIPRA